MVSQSVGYTIMGKTADLTLVQKTSIDSMHKEGKTQKVIVVIFYFSEILNFGFSLVVSYNHQSKKKQTLEIHQSVCNE